ncbi:MAG: hypothetical protein ACXVUE_20275 [Solirubrobacteraceae bacterium]
MTDTAASGAERRDRRFVARDVGSGRSGATESIEAAEARPGRTRGCIPIYSVSGLGVVPALCSVPGLRLVWPGARQPEILDPSQRPTIGNGI